MKPESVQNALVTAASNGCEPIIRLLLDAAIVNAVVDALSHLGVWHIDIPITPGKVWRILKEKGVAE